jgi:DNA-binding protein Fis
MGEGGRSREIGGRILGIDRGALRKKMNSRLRGDEMFF